MKHRRDHVVGDDPLQVPANLFGIQFLPRCNNRQNPAAATRFGMQGRRLGHVWQAMEGGLDFFELNPVTHVFDLVVLPAVDVEPAIRRVEAHEVAGLIHPLLELVVAGVLDKAGGGALRIVVVAFANVRPQQTQLADLAIRRHPAVVAQNQVSKVFGNMSERRQSGRIVEVGSRELAGRADAGAFGRPINVVELAGVLVGVVELLELGVGIPFAPKHEAPDGPEVFAVRGLHSLEEDQQRGHGEPERTSRPVNFLDQHLRVANLLLGEGNQARPVEERRVEVEDRVVKVERVDVRQDVLGRNGIGLPAPFDEVENIRMGHDSALREAGGTRSIHDVGGATTGDEERFRQIRVRLTGEQRGQRVRVLVQMDHAQLDWKLTQAGGKIGFRDQQLRPAGGDDLPKPLDRAVGIQHAIGRAELQAGQHRREGMQALGPGYGHHAGRANPVAEQHPRHAVGQRVQFRIADAWAIADAQRRAVRVPARSGLESDAEIVAIHGRAKFETGGDIADGSELDHQAAINLKNLAGEEVVFHHGNDGLRDFLRLAEPAERNALDDFLQDRLAQRTLRGPGFAVTGRHSGDADSHHAQFLRPRGCQRIDAGFGSRVGGLADIACGGHGADVDNNATGPGGDHFLDNAERRVEDGAEVGVENLSPHGHVVPDDSRGRQAHERGAVDDAGVIHQHVGGPKSLVEPRRRGGHLVVVREITLEANHRRMGLGQLVQPLGV